MNRARKQIAATMFLLVAPTLVLALPFGAQISQVDDDAELRFQVDAYALEMAEDPPSHYMVLRKNTVPDMVGSIPFTVWLPFPPNGENYHTTYLDPHVAELGAGHYEVLGLWSNGDEEVLDAEWFALVEHPYIMRGALMSATTVDPCVGYGLLECAEVELVNPDWWDEIGPGVLLDIYGWPTRLDGRDNCKVRITWVELMPADADCNDPMATEEFTWSTVRALYR